MSENLDTSHPLWRLVSYASSFRRTIRLAITCSFLNKLFDLAPPLLIGAAVDVVIEREDSFVSRIGFTDPKSQIAFIAVLTVIIWGLESLFQYAYAVLWRNLAQTLQHKLRVDAFRQVSRLDGRYFDDSSTGGLMSILSDDVNQLERFLDGGANSLIHLATTFVLVTICFFVMAPAVAWMAMLPIPIVIWGSLTFQSRIAPRYDDVRQKVEDLNHRLANALSGMTTIKSFNAEAYELHRLTVSSSAYRTSNQKAIRLSAAFSPLIRMVIVVGFTATLVVGGFQAIDGKLAVGIYSVFVFMTQRLLWPLTGLGMTLDLYQRAMASTRRILDLLDLQTEIKTGDTALSVDEAAQADVLFDNVTFAYHRGTPILQNVALRCPARSTTAIVGATGSGKTSIIKLLLRFYDGDDQGNLREGAIRVGGHEIRDLSLVDLRRSVSLVSQDVFLFHGTVRENIAYGLAGIHPAGDDELAAVNLAYDELVIQAAKAAEAHVFIEALPNGYDTVVGERGQKLSGGQRQRISLARALLKNAPILLLDEATSAVDNETEAAIQRSLRRIEGRQTTIVIAHRLSTIRHADRIYVLDGGRVIEDGTHDQLIGKQGIYANLWSVQTGDC